MIVAGTIYRRALWFVTVFCALAIASWGVADDAAYADLLNAARAKFKQRMAAALIR